LQHRTGQNRDLLWDGCLNVRDLGGHPTEDGGETLYGRVVRADSIRQLSAEGWKALVGYGVRTIVDLRGERELEDDPPTELPVDVVHVPFMEDRPEVFEKAEDAARKAPDHAVATRDVYLIFLESFRANVAAVIGAVAEAPEGAVVIHCMGGKDRTGLTAAFLLRLAGVGLEDIGSDYALSEKRLRPRHDQWIAQASNEAEREYLRRISATPAASMVAVIEELERRHRSVEGFLRAGGAPDRTGERIRARLRG
jgi:protein-tyrosine phosphatase